MKRLRLPLGSVEGVEWRVRMDDDDSDPTGFTLEWALVATTVDDGTTITSWEEAAWVEGGPPYRGRALVTVEAGALALWSRISGSGEEVLRRVGIVEGI